VDLPVVQEEVVEVALGVLVAYTVLFEELAILLFGESRGADVDAHVVDVAG
jgi:hypothetical protein